MNTKQLVLIASSILTLASCGEEKANKSTQRTLDASLINNPHSADPQKVIDVAELPTMDFTDTTYDFGTFHEGESAVHEFEFTNNGKTPLLVSQASGTCGCTVPDYPRSPIAPGEKGIITVKFNSQGKTGIQSKRVDIYTNSARGTHCIYINAEVLDK